MTVATLPKINMDELERALSAELNKVVPLDPGHALVKTPDPESEVEQLASVHRASIAKREQRVADRQRDMTATVASLERAQEAERERHAVEMRRLSAAIAEAQEAGERDIAADRRIIQSSKAALDALE